MNKTIISALFFLFCFELGWGQEFKVDTLPKTDTVEYSLDYWGDLVKQAGTEHKLILLYFSASYCPPCRNMEEGVFVSKYLMDYINKNYVFRQLDAVENFDGIELAQKYQVKYYPTLIMFDEMGQNPETLVGYQSVSALLGSLKKYKTKTNNQ